MSYRVEKVAVLLQNLNQEHCFCETKALPSPCTQWRRSWYEDSLFDAGVVGPSPLPLCHPASRMSQQHLPAQCLSDQRCQNRLPSFIIIVIISGYCFAVHSWFATYRREGAVADPRVEGKVSALRSQGHLKRSTRPSRHHWAGLTGESWYGP